MAQSTRASRRQFFEDLGRLVAGAAAGSIVARLDGADPAPLAAYPRLEPLLRREADRLASPFAGGVTLDPARAAYTPSLAGLDVAPGRAAGQVVAPDGLLTFAIDLTADSYVTGELTLDPDDDLRPGLRVSVLCDSTLVAAPMVEADPWGIERITDPAPTVTGRRPDSRVALSPWRLKAGRRYVTIAGPHFRAGGRLRRLILQAAPRPVDRPLYTFALIADTHLRFQGREEWMNVKMGAASAGAFAATLHALAGDGIDFVLHGGDMTESALRDEFALLAGVLRAQPLPVFGCMGNHDVYLASSRPDARELLADHFPGGALDYVIDRPPLKFVVMDVEIERPEVREEKQEWLRRTLAADSRTPTVFVWHYAPFNRAGTSSCGFRMHDWSVLGREAVLPILRTAPNLIAMLNGHDHWDEVNDIDGVAHVQNAAFVEWPNTYRVFRVYPDRIEWEVRQVANRGFVRESFAPAKAMSWMIATREHDLTGAIPVTRGPRESMA